MCTGSRLEKRTGTHVTTKTLLSWIYLDLSHHAPILMIQDVAVIEKRPRNFRIAKIHTDRHAGVRHRTIPIRYRVRCLALPAYPRELR